MLSFLEMVCIKLLQIPKFMVCLKDVVFLVGCCFLGNLKISEYEQLKSSLTKKIEGWRFHPLVKKKVWDRNI